MYSLSQFNGKLFCTNLKYFRNEKERHFISLPLFFCLSFFSENIIYSVIFQSLILYIFIIKFHIKTQ